MVYRFLRKHRTKRSKGCPARETALIMVFKLIKNAEKTGRRLDGKNQLSKVILGVKFLTVWKSLPRMKKQLLDPSSYLTLEGQLKKARL